MKLILSALMILSSAPTMSVAQTITQTVDVSWMLDDPPAQLEFAPFDLQNGQRELTKVSVGFAGSIDLEVLIQNFSSLDLEANDWFFDAAATVILAFDQEAGYEDGGPLFGLGGPFIQGITGSLSAGSGGPIFVDPSPGLVEVTASAGEEVNSHVTTGVDLDYFTSGNTISAQTQPFLDFILTPPLEDPNAFINASALELVQEGTLTLAYEYVETLGRPEDCNGDGMVDFEDLRCVCEEPHANLEDVLSAVGIFRGDLDGNGEVAFADFLILSGQFGKPGDYVQGDLNCNGTVDFSDFLLLSANFGSQAEGIFLATVPDPMPAVYPWWIAACLLGWRRARQSGLTACPF